MTIFGLNGGNVRSKINTSQRCYLVGHLFIGLWASNFQ